MSDTMEEGQAQPEMIQKDLIAFKLNLDKQLASRVAILIFNTLSEVAEYQASMGSVIIDPTIVANIKMPFAPVASLFIRYKEIEKGKEIQDRMARLQVNNAFYTSQAMEQLNWLNIELAMFCDRHNFKDSTEPKKEPWMRKLKKRLP